MGLFTDFLIRGFTEEQGYLYSPGTLYEVMGGLGIEMRHDEMRKKVETLLAGWSTDAETFLESGERIPTYALELHAINDKNSPNNGYGTYIFLPDEKNSVSIPGIESVYSRPIELYDDEDPIKILSAMYADKAGFPMPVEGAPTVYEMSVERHDYYPIKYWDKTSGSDPLDEIFGVFEGLKSGEYAGVSLVVVPPQRDWYKRGRARIREIEDPSYIGDPSELGVIATFRKILNDEDLPGEGIDRMVYDKQRLDTAEKAEIKAIETKIEGAEDRFRCTLRVYASSEQIANTITGIITQKTSGRYNKLVISERHGNLIDLATRVEGRSRFVLSTQEIPMIWHVVSDGGSGVSNKIHKAMPDALIPPEELITIPIGDPGDIQKLIYSINSTIKAM